MLQLPCTLTTARAEGKVLVARRRSDGTTGPSDAARPIGERPDEGNCTHRRGGRDLPPALRRAGRYPPHPDLIETDGHPDDLFERDTELGKAVSRFTNGSGTGGLGGLLE